MLTGFFSGVSGVLYNEQKLAVVSNNAANVDTPAFRRSLMMIRSRETTPERSSVHSSVRARTPKNYGIERSGIFKDYKKTGSLRETGNQLDLAIPSELSNAFFAVRRTDANDSKVYYTRNGSLSLGRANPGNPNSPTVLYMGRHIALDEGEQPISIDPSRGELTISPEGTIYQNNTEVGEIPLFRLNKSADPRVQVAANLQFLTQKGESLFEIPEQYKNEFNPLRLRAGDEGIQRLMVQGMREGSNVNMFQELTEMMGATRASTANITAIKTQIDTLTKLFQMVRS